MLLGTDGNNKLIKTTTTKDGGSNGDANFDHTPACPQICPE
jgi:hypothetical protein